MQIKIPWHMLKISHELRLLYSHGQLRLIFNSLKPIVFTKLMSEVFELAHA